MHVWQTCFGHLRLARFIDEVWIAGTSGHSLMSGQLLPLASTRWFRYAWGPYSMMKTHIWRTVGIRSRPISVVIFAESKQRAFSLGLECLDAMKASIPDHHVSVFKHYLNYCSTLTASRWHIWVYFVMGYHLEQKEERMAIPHLTYTYILF